MTAKRKNNFKYRQSDKEFTYQSNRDRHEKRYLTYLFVVFFLGQRRIQKPVKYLRWQFL